MVLVDTSVWVDHLRRGNKDLVAILQAGEAVCHPFVIGELACGQIRHREMVLELLSALPFSPKASDSDVLGLIARHRLMGKGLGLVDIHLLASSALAKIPVWTLDARLIAAANSFGLAWNPGQSR